VDDPYVRLQQYLRPGERLLWSGRPDPAILFTSADAFLIPLSMMWGGFAAFWEVGVSFNGHAGLGVVFGIPFVAVGVYITVGRFFYKRYRKKRTCYGITDQRAIAAVTPGPVSDSPLWNQPVTVRRSGDGRHATVIIGSGLAQRRGSTPVSAAVYANTGMELMARNMVLPVAFYDVADPDAMLSAMDQARGPAPVA
jgi:hypothetical protein